jgi:RNA polymerase sigma-70 factor (ECF subfamily)
MIALSNSDWAAHRAALKRFVGKRVSDREDVNDIVQDVLVRAHEVMHQLDDAERLLAWLGRIAANRVVDHYRARRTLAELPDDLAAPEPDDDPVTSLAPCLPAMVERLPDTYRDAVRLSGLEEVPQRDVARRLGVSLSGAKSRVQRGRERLRELVEACCRVVMTGSKITDYERRIVQPSARDARSRCAGVRLS